MSYSARLRKPDPAARQSGAASRSLRINKPNDSFECEADRAAGEAIAGGKAKWSGGGRGFDSEAASEAPPIVGNVLQSPGRPLDAPARAFFEARFGHDFSRVRVHTDSQAAESARAVNAHAYTAGHKIAFGAGQYMPGTNRGNRLIAHELTHVLQQTAAGGGKSWAGPAIQRQSKTAAEIAGEELKTGPTQKRGDKADWEQAEKRAREEAKKAGATSPAIQVSRSNKNDGVRPLPAAEFQQSFRRCPTARPENGLPEAFLCADSSVLPWQTRMDKEATLDTDVHVGTKSGARGGGEVWVSSAALQWSLKAAGFLDVSRIDPGMLNSVREHERGHADIEEQVADRLAKLMEADLRRSLPQEKMPLKESGRDWVQNGINAIDKKIEGIKNRYLDWAHELAARANDAWDSQEAKALSRIAAAKKHGHEATAPTAP